MASSCRPSILGWIKRHFDLLNTDKFNILYKQLGWKMASKNL